MTIARFLLVCVMLIGLFVFFVVAVSGPNDGCSLPELWLSAGDTCNQRTRADANVEMARIEARRESTERITLALAGVAVAYIVGAAYVHGQARRPPDVVVRLPENVRTEQIPDIWAHYDEDAMTRGYLVDKRRNRHEA